jgi:GAF domain-containing protein
VSLLSGDLAHDARNVELLLRTMDELYAVRGLEELVRVVLDRTLELLSADRAALLLSGPGGLEAAVARGAGGLDLAADEVLTQSLPDRG